jgi:curved DNA-binding protein CbpA
MNPYQVLQVSEKASGEVIRAAWAALVRECHPDGPKPNPVRTRALNEAYAILKDPAKRQVLDASLRVPKKTTAEPKRRRTQPQVRQETHGDVMPAYPPAYNLAFSEEVIADAIEDLKAEMPPWAKVALDFAHRASRGGRS